MGNLGTSKFPIFINEYEYLQRDYHKLKIMAEIPFLVKDLALILMVAGIVTLIFKRLKQPLVLGYIVAGFLVSPHMPYTMSVMDETDIQTWADIGVIFTLFSLGLDFSFKKIVKMGALPIIACIVIVFSMMMLGISVGHSFGWGRMDCIFLGGMLAMSSTTIIYKAFDDMGLRQQQFAGLVEKLLGKQGKKSNDLMDLLKGLKNGTIKVDEATAAQAQKEIGEDGYWGVEQTSNRLVEMAKALSGNDPEKADAMIAAMENGFKQATKAFGDDLPSICRDTVDAATKKLNDWKASFNSTTETAATEE